MTDQVVEILPNEGQQKEAQPYDVSGIQVVYWLYIVGSVLSILGMPIGALMWLVAMIWASLLSPDGMPDWVKTHVRLQKRTFWLGLVYGAMVMLFFSVFMMGIFSDISGRSVLSAVSFYMLSGVGIVGFLFLAWVLVRCIRGLQLQSKQAAYPFPQRWGF